MKVFNRKYLLFKAIVLAALVAVVSFFLIAPRVVTMSLEESQGAGEPYLAIDFDKPVARQEIVHVIAPQVLGEWRFEKPLLARHLFRRLIFVPAVPLEPDTQYQVTLENMVNPFTLGTSGNFSAHFTTQKSSPLAATGGQPQTPTLSPAPSPLQSPGPEEKTSKTHIIPVDFNWQKYSLSCEAASLKMALSAKDLTVSEDSIMAQIGYDPTPRKGNVWGDPYLHFVGDINGKICDTGFGVYWTAVGRAANTWRPSAAFSHWTLDQLINELDAGNPVIMWGVLPGVAVHDCSWYTSSGKYVKAYKETHVRLIVGYLGDSKNPEKIVLKDPLQGDLYWSKNDFLTNWGFFDNSGVVIR